MKRLIAICALVTLAFVAAAAQEAPKPDQVTLRGVTKIKLSKLIELASADTGIAISMDAKFDAEVEIVAPRAGESKAGDSLMMLVQEALETQQLAMVANGESYKVASTRGIHWQVPTIDESGLATLKPWQWVKVGVAVEGDHYKHILAALRNFVTRSGGMMISESPNTLLICERGDRLARLLNLVQRLDAESAGEAEIVRLPKRLAPEDVVLALHNLFATRPGVHFRVEADPDKHAVILKAAPALRAEVKQAIELLK